MVLKMSFTVAVSTVGMMLLYAFPGFIMIKSGLLKNSAISDFAKLLMYVCQPALIVYSFMKVEFSLKTVKEMLFVFVFIFIFQTAVLLFFFFLFRKKRSDVKYRVYTLATCFGNCAFMGVPILEALLPDYPEAIVFSAVFSLSMNILGWSLGSAIITNNRKYMSAKKIFLNPAVLSLIVAIPLFVTGIELPSQLDGMITILARMTTPLCMIIMGMRLATESLREVFGHISQYLIILVKQMIFPLFALLILLPLPIEHNMKAAIYIMASCPVASVVLNFAEMLGEGQDSAANLVLLGTSMSAVTIPVMVLLI